MNYLDILYANLSDDGFGYFSIEKQISHCKDSEKLFLNIELKCQGFFLQEGKLHPIMEFSEVKVSDIKSFTDEEIQYIKDRLDKESSDILGARYAHILFDVTKNRIYAIKAIGLYKKIALDYYQQLIDEKKTIYDFTDIVYAYLKLAEPIKYKIESIKSEVFDFYHREKHHLFYYLRLLDIILKCPLFKRNDLLGCTINALDNWFKNRSYSHDEEFLKLCLTLAKKEGVNLKPIYVYLAEIHLETAEREKDRDEARFILSDCLFEASHYYKLAGETELSNKYIKEFEMNKPDMKFNVISHELSQKSITTLQEAYRDISSTYLNNKTSVFIPLAFDKRLLPKLNDIENQNSLSLLFNTSQYDMNMNIKVLSEFEKKRNEKFSQYKMGLEITLVMLFEELQKQMKEEKRNLVNEGLEYFSATWINETFSQSYSDEVIEYKWLDSLRPAIKILLEATTEDKNNYLSPIEQMTFDQLAIKFEGILRDICQIAGLVTTKVYNKETVQMDINDLLQDESLKNTFEKSDLDLWQYTFTRAGYNIRNDVAHAFLKPPHYTVRKANLLILCYVKIARYGELLNRKI